MLHCSVVAYIFTCAYAHTYTIEFKTAELLRPALIFHPMKYICEGHAQPTDIDTTVHLRICSYLKATMHLYRKTLVPSFDQCPTYAHRHGSMVWKSTNPAWFNIRYHKCCWYTGHSRYWSLVLNYQCSAEYILTSRLPWWGDSKQLVQWQVLDSVVKLECLGWWSYNIGDDSCVGRMDHNCWGWSEWGHNHTGGIRKSQMCHHRDHITNRHNFKAECKTAITPIW